MTNEAIVVDRDWIKENLKINDQELVWFSILGLLPVITQYSKDLSGKEYIDQFGNHEHKWSRTCAITMPYDTHMIVFANVAGQEHVEVLNEGVRNVFLDSLDAETFEIYITKICNLYRANTRKQEINVFEKAMYEYAQLVGKNSRDIPLRERVAIKNSAFVKSVEERILQNNLTVNEREIMSETSIEILKDVLGLFQD